MSRKAIPIAVALLVVFAASAARAAVRTDAAGNVIWNNHHIDLTLRVSDDVSGVETVELWYRRQGGEWRKWHEQPRAGTGEGRFVVGFDAPDDGVYEFYSVSKDKVGNTSGTPTEHTTPRIVINFDTTPPELEVLFQHDYKTLAPGSAVKFNWFAEDDNLKSVWVRYYWDEAADKPSQQTFAGDSGLYSIPIPAEGVGHLTMQVVAEDYAGFKTTTRTFVYEIKEQPPEPAPVEPRRVHDTPEAKATEPKETGDVIEKRDTGPGRGDTAPDQRNGEQDGDHPARTGRATDRQEKDAFREGPTAQTEPLARSEPSVADDRADSERKHARQRTAPEQDEFRPSPLQVGIRYNVVQSGPSGLDRVELWYARVGVEEWKKNWRLHKFSNSGTGTFVFEAPEIGEYAFYIVARNRAGYWSKPRPDGRREIEPDYTRWIDPYAPFLKIISPKGGEILKGGSEVCVRWVANDDNLLERPIKIELYTGNKRILVVENATENDGEHSFLFPYKKGKYRIKVSATDKAGHVTEKRTPEFLIDSGPPTVAIQVLEEEYIREDIGIADSPPTRAGRRNVEPEPGRSYAPEADSNSMTDDDAREAFNRGAALLAKGRAEQALEPLRRAAAHFDTDDKIINEYGIALYQLKRYTPALERFRRAAALAPDNSGYLWNIFLADYGLQDADASAQAAIDVLRADPNRVEGRSMIDAVIGLYSRAGRDSGINDFLQKVINSAKLSDSLREYVQSRMR